MKKLIEMSQLVTDFVDVATLKHLFKQDSGDPKAYKLLEGIINKKYNNDSFLNCLDGNHFGSILFIIF